MAKLFSTAIFFVIIALLLEIPVAAAQMGPKNGDTWQPALPGPAPAVAAPLVVTDVVVDKTAGNPVIAREQAIEESKRAAFMKLAEQNLSPDQMKHFQPPKDSDIAMLVQDFEIQNEQMSSTRYVGTFTVRFRDIVRNYISIRDIAPPLEENLAQQDFYEGGYDTRRRPPLLYTGRAPSDGRTQGAMPVHEDDGGQIAQTVLILPYFENVAGRTLLWEEGNPWLRMWQNAMPKSPAGGRQFFVPLGDISDIASGASNGVWSGDYRAVDALMRAYGAEQTVLAVANKSGDALTVDIYTYAKGALKRRSTLKPYAEDATGQEAYKKAMLETIAYLQAPHARRHTPPPRVVESISRDVTREWRDGHGTVVIDSRTQGTENFDARRPLVSSSAPYNPPPAHSSIPVTVVSSATNIDATMQFSDPSAWMDMQRRVAGLQPPVQVNISSLSANSVSFTLSSSAPIDVVKRSLLARGVELRPPAMEGGVVGRPVYDVRLGPVSQQP